jgi:L-seryl-tRNA(Ser) seleniumtransferase
VREVPALAMLTASAADVADRARHACAELRARGLECDVVASEASVGGGAFPTARIASSALALGGDAMEMERALRAAPVPIVGRIASDRLVLDMRSVPAAHDAAFVDAVATALGATP